MDTPKVCLTLTGRSFIENIETYRRYKNYVDIVELRADYLNEEDQFRLREFPSMIGIPCILTIRRKRDGGQFVGNEFTRTQLFSRALAFADNEKSHNFNYVDFEDDFNVASLNDIALAFSVRIIRSLHSFDGPVFNLRDTFSKMQHTPNEIFKIAFMPNNLSDVSRLFEEAKLLHGVQYIVLAMGPLGVVSRILAAKLGSCLTYTSPASMDKAMRDLGHMDPVTLVDMYHFRRINKTTRIFAVTGWPLKSTNSPLLHNSLYQKHNMDCVFIPLPAASIDEAMEFAKVARLRGLAITVPHKEKVISLLDEVDANVGEIGSCNTAVLQNKGPLDYIDRNYTPHWLGHNTDAVGFLNALIEFMGTDKLSKKKVAIIGAGGAARAIAYVIKTLGCKTCIFNRTVERAQSLASLYGFKAAPLCPDSYGLLERYSDIIVQTTNVGMNYTPVDGKNPQQKQYDPIWFYEFMGTEHLFDIIYTPDVTPVMARAKAKGCSVCNGIQMLKEQGYAQFKYFTGVDYDDFDAE